MTTRFPVAALILIAAVYPVRAPAQVSGQATALVTFEVQPIDQVSISGEPGPLLLTPSGTAPDTTIDASTTWSVVTNQDARKITATLDAPMPSGVRLAVRLEAPPGATTAGTVDLAASPSDLITSLARTSASDLTVSYFLSASTAAGPVRGTRKVTFTIVGDV